MSTRRHWIRPLHVVVAILLTPVALFFLHWGMLGFRRANIDCTNGTTVYFVEWPDFSIEEINGEGSEYSVESVAMVFGNQRAELVGSHFPAGDKRADRSVRGSAWIGETITYPGVGTFTLIEAEPWYLSILHGERNNATFCYIPEPPLTIHPPK